MGRTLNILFCLTLLGCSSAALAAGNVVYKWVDENGVVHYTASLPPDKAGGAHSTLNRQGRVVGSVDAGMTEARRAELAQEELEAQERDREASVQTNEDRRLLATYRSEADIAQARERQVTVAMGELKATEQGVREQLISLSSRVRLAAQAERSGQPVADNLKQEIQSLQADLGARQAALQMIRQKIVTIENTFEEDVRRYRELVSSSAS